MSGDNRSHYSLVLPLASTVGLCSRNSNVVPGAGKSFMLHNTTITTDIELSTNAREPYQLDALTIEYNIRL